MNQLVLRPPALVVAGASACAVVAGFAAHVSPKTSIAAVLAALAIAALRRWPIAIWVAVLAVVLLFSNEAQGFVVLPAGAFTVYGYDALPLLAIVAAWSGGASRTLGPSSARLAVACGTVFLLTVAVAWLRTVETIGLTPAMQARKLFPLVVAVVIPLAGTRLAGVRSRDIATVFSLAAIALAARTLFLLATGTEAVYGGTQQVTEVSSVLGVERVFQTWEPFLGAAVGLTLLAYVLVARSVTPLHVVGLAASAIPVVFGFFRIAWVFAALVGLLVLALAPGRRRASLVAGFAVLCVVFVAASALMKTSGPSYLAQFLSRSSEITSTLDSYRSQEYGAVWREIEKEPIFGQGFGTEYEGTWTTLRSWAHNAYQWLWWRVGIVGVLAFLGFIVGAMVAGIRSGRYLANRDDRGLAFGLTAALLFTALAANFHENFETAQTNLFIGLAMGQILLLARRLDDSTAS